MAPDGATTIGLLHLFHELLHLIVPGLPGVGQELFIEVRTLQSVILDADQIEDDVLADFVITRHALQLPETSHRKTAAMMAGETHGPRPESHSIDATANKIAAISYTIVFRKVKLRRCDPRTSPKRRSVSERQKPG